MHLIGSPVPTSTFHHKAQLNDHTKLNDRTKALEIGIFFSFLCFSPGSSALHILNLQRHGFSLPGQGDETEKGGAEGSRRDKQGELRIASDFKGQTLEQLFCEWMNP